MVRDLAIDAEIVACATVRDADGLALSSRNAYLGEDERDAAGVLFEALADAAGRVRAGGRDARVLVAEIARTVGAIGGVRLDYAAIVDEETFEQVEQIERPARALLAARVGGTRLIDNVRLDPS
jgi:pantoate--beta-alanine ligase